MVNIRKMYYIKISTRPASKIPSQDGRISGSLGPDKLLWFKLTCEHLTKSCQNSLFIKIQVIWRHLSSTTHVAAASVTDNILHLTRLFQQFVLSSKSLTKLTELYRSCHNSLKI